MEGKAGNTNNSVLQPVSCAMIRRDSHLLHMSMHSWLMYHPRTFKGCKVKELACLKAQMLECLRHTFLAALQRQLHSVLRRTFCMRFARCFLSILCKDQAQPHGRLTHNINVFCLPRGSAEQRIPPCATDTVCTITARPLSCATWSHTPSCIPDMRKFKKSESNHETDQLRP